MHLIVCMSTNVSLVNKVIYIYIYIYEAERNGVLIWVFIELVSVAYMMLKLVSQSIAHTLSVGHWVGSVLNQFGPQIAPLTHSLTAQCTLANNEHNFPLFTSVTHAQSAVSSANAIGPMSSSSSSYRPPYRSSRRAVSELDGWCRKLHPTPPHPALVDPASV